MPAGPSFPLPPPSLILIVFMSRLKEGLALLKETGREVAADNCMAYSAAIAYSTLFSLPPLLVVIVAVVGSFFGAEAVQGQITEQVSGLVGEESAAEIETMIRNASEFGGGSLGGKLIGVIALIVGATGAFGQLQKALNRAWSVEPKAGGIPGLLLKRVLSFGFVLTIAFLLLVSLVLSAMLSAFGDVVEAWLGAGMAGVMQAANFALSLALVTALFAAIFRWLPDAEIAWRDVWVGAAVTALLFTVGKTLIGLYLGQSDVGSAFGAAGSVVVILVWVYYTALILLVGAEFTQVWARHHGARIRPGAHAVRVVEEKRVVQGGEAGAARDAAADAGEAADSGKAAPPYVHPRDPAPRSGWNE